MNKKQRRMLSICRIIMVVMLIFPPFYIQEDGNGAVNLGYGFVLSPPHYDDYSDYVGSVNTTLLLTQWIGVCLFAGLSYQLAKDT